MNCVSLILKIVEEPKQQFFGYKSSLTVTKLTGKYIVRRNRNYINTIKVKTWGKLAYQVKEYYSVNDYILIEGFLQIKKEEENSNSPQTIELTAERIFPFLMDSATSPTNSSIL